MDMNGTKLPNDTTNTTTAFASTTPYPEAVVSQHLWAGIGITIIIIGTVGHLLSIVVMGSSKSMRVQSSTVYIITMSVAGIVNLYIGLLRYVIFIGISKWDLDVRDHSEFICKLHMTVAYASLQYFAWLQATVAVDRLISVLRPHQYMISVKWKAGLITVLVELLLVVLLNIGVTLSVGRDAKGYCVPTAQYFFFKIWGYIDLLSFSLIPALIMVVCNSVILKLLNKSKLKVGSGNSVARSLTVMLMSLNAIFIITTLPVSIVFFLDWGPFSERRYAIIELCWTIFSLLQYAGSACTFFVYCITGTKFREELQQLFICLHNMKQSKIGTKLSDPSLAISSSQRAKACNYKSLSVSMPTEETSVTDCAV